MELSILIIFLEKGLVPHTLKIRFINYISHFTDTDKLSSSLAVLAEMFY